MGGSAAPVASRAARDAITRPPAKQVDELLSFARLSGNAFHRIYPHSTCALAAVCVALAAAAARVARPAAAAEDLTALLARAVSPGSIALLAEHATQPAAQKRLIEAVKHEDPAVRAVAARVAFVTMSKGVAPALISAVAKEEDIHTGAEQVRALMGLLGAPGDAIVLGAVKRLGAPAAIAAAESLTRTRPEDIPRHLPVLAAAVPKSDMPELGATLASAAVQHPTHAKAIVEAVLAAKSDDLWKAVLEPLRLTGRRVPPAALLAGRRPRRSLSASGCCGTSSPSTAKARRFPTT